MGACSWLLERGLLLARNSMSHQDKGSTSLTAHLRNEVLTDEACQAPAGGPADTRGRSAALDAGGPVLEAGRLVAWLVDSDLLACKPQEGQALLHVPLQSTAAQY